jgi:hypothetical protein
MAKYTTTVDLTDEETELFENYLNDNCYDAKKWLSRQLYTCVARAASKYKRPTGKQSKVFSLEKYAGGT